MTKSERIAKYLEACPAAESGYGGHNQTFKVVCALYKGWALSEEETLMWLRVYNRKCLPPWSERELMHKVQSAARVAHNNPRGYLIKPEDRENPETWTAKKTDCCQGYLCYATFRHSQSRVSARARAHKPERSGASVA